MEAKEIRQKYLEFFREKGHKVIQGASLIPENDPSVLFTTAGMHPLVPYLMGESHPAGQRLVDFQKCVRTGDIEEVGGTTHHTFFEMLGNWSLGEYFKKESLEWSWKFLTSKQWLGLDPQRLAVSVFAGDKDAPFDEESYKIWVDLGVNKKRIAKLPKSANWWGPAGETGPCGPDSEIFYWVGDADKIPESFNDDNDLWVEIWNNVFMEYNKSKVEKKEKYEFIKLAQKNVDTGMGLERITAVMQGLADDYQTELWANQISKIEELSGKKYSENKKEMRIIADHLKASTFILADERGISPSNTDQGYVVRRLIRRAIRYGKQLGITKELWTKEIAKVVINDYKDVYPELERNKKFVLEQLDREEIQFSKTLEKGLRELRKMSIGQWGEYDAISGVEIESPGMEITGQNLFLLFSTFGFPFEMSIEELDKLQNILLESGTIRKKIINEKKKEHLKKDFEKKMKQHQDLSRTASVGKFKGGLADNSEGTTRLHTTAHLLLAALRKVLDKDVQQKGSNITAERLRFDFSYDKKLTEEQKAEVESLVNEAIQKDLPVICEEMSLEDAKQAGAVGAFESKYGGRVKVYKIADGVDVFSYEICGGPHVNRLGELGRFKITKEESSSAGVRRIKAVLS